MPPGEIRESEPARVVFPMQLRVGDRLSRADGEWEVVGEPSDLYGGKMVEAWLARPEDHAAKKYMAWAANEKITVRRPATDAKA